MQTTFLTSYERIIGKIHKLKQIESKDYYEKHSTYINTAWLLFLHKTCSDREVYHIWERTKARDRKRKEKIRGKYSQLFVKNQGKLIQLNLILSSVT